MNNLHLMTRTDKGIGGYTDSVSYKLANGDLSRKQAAEILQTTMDRIPATWTWDDHEALIEQSKLS